MSWQEANIRPALEAAIEAEMLSREHSPLFITNVKNPHTLFNYLTKRSEFELAYRKIWDHEDPVAEAQKNNTTPTRRLRGITHELAFAVTYPATVEAESGQRLVAIRGRDQMEVLSNELAWARLMGTPNSAAAARILEGKFYDPDILIIDTETYTISESDEISTNPYGLYVGKKRKKLEQARLEFPEAFRNTKLVFGIPAELEMQRFNEPVNLEEAPYTLPQFDEFLAQLAKSYAPEGLRPLIDVHPKLAEGLIKTAEKSAKIPQRKQGQRRLRRSFANR